MIFQLWYGFQLFIPIPCSSWHEHCWFHDGPATLPWQSTSRRGCNPPTTHPLWACQWWFPERNSIESLHFHASNMPAAPILRSSQKHFWRTVPAPLQRQPLPHPSPSPSAHQRVTTYSVSCSSNGWMASPEFPAKICQNHGLLQQRQGSLPTTAYYKNHFEESRISTKLNQSKEFFPHNGYM